MPRIKPIKPKQGQESVWDYPRPPRMQKLAKNEFALSSTVRHL